MKLKFAITVLFCVAMQFLAQAQPVKQLRQLDTKKSKILWNTGKMMGGHYGFMLFTSGSLQYSDAGQPVSGLFLIDMNSIRGTDSKDEKNKRRVDSTLRVPGFFGSDEYPTSTVKINKLTRVGATSTYKAVADLTIKGITNPIEFTANIDTKADSTYITGTVDIQHTLWNINHKPQTDKLDFLSNIKETIVPTIHVTLDMVLIK